MAKKVIWAVVTLALVLIAAGLVANKLRALGFFKAIELIGAVLDPKFLDCRLNYQRPTP